MVMCRRLKASSICASDPVCRTAAFPATKKLLGFCTDAAGAVLAGICMLRTTLCRVATWAAPYCAQMRPLSMAGLEGLKTPSISSMPKYYCPTGLSLRSLSGTRSWSRACRFWSWTGFVTSRICQQSPVAEVLLASLAGGWHDFESAISDSQTS